MKKIPACPVATPLMLIIDRWKVLILRELLGKIKPLGKIITCW